LKYKRCVELGAFILFVVCFALSLRDVFPAKTRKIEFPQSLRFQQRGFVNEGRNDLIYKSRGPHVVTTQIQRSGDQTANGLFAESSIVSPYVYATLEETFVDPFVWYNEIAPGNSRELSKHLSALGINWILSSSPISEVKAKSMNPKNSKIILVNEKIDGQVQPRNFYLYELGTSLAEFFAEPPLFVETDKSWNEFLNQWWVSGEAAIPVQGHNQFEVLPSRSSNDAVSFTASSFDNFQLEILSNKKRWVYVKVPYFPNWHASIHHQEIPILKAGPNLMAVYGQGDVEFSFRRSALEIWSAMITVTFLIMMITTRFIYSSCSS
jgi:hypothetical protein